MFDPGIIKGLSDQQLAMSVKGQGSVPGWAALAELQNRNNLRASAPVQAPQGTVADGVVAKALGQAGLTPQPQQQQVQPQSGIGAQAPMQQPQGGISAGVPQSFKKGGIVALAGGTTPSNQDIQDVTAQYLPQFQTPVAQQISYNPSYTPTDTTLDQAQSKIDPLYGESPDYKGQLNQVQQNQQRYGTYNPGAGEFLTTLVGNVMSNQTNPIGGFGRGLAQAQQNEVQARQQNFANSLASIEQTGKITENQQRRAQAMAQSVQNYTEHQQGLADSQDKMRLAAAQHNATASMDAQKEANSNAQSLSADKINLARNMGDPDTLLSMINTGDPKSKAVLSPLLAGINAQRQTQLQQASDVEQKRQMAIASQEHQNRMGEIAQQQASELDRQTKMLRAQYNINQGLDPNAPTPGTGQNRATDSGFLQGALQGLVRVNPRDKDYKAIESTLLNVDPTWTPARYEAREAYTKKLTSGDVANSLKSLTTLTQHMGHYEDISNQVGTSPSVAFNLTRGPQGVALKDTSDAAGTELARTLEGGQPNESAIKQQQDDLFSVRGDKRQAAINNAYTLVGGRLNSIMQQHFAATGQSFPVDQYIDPESRKTLMAHGVDIYKMARDTNQTIKNPAAPATTDSNVQAYANKFFNGDVNKAQAAIQKQKAGQ